MGRDRECGPVASQERILRDCASISDGTLATLTGYRRYDQLAAIERGFVQWVREQQAAGVEFEHWMDAWRVFEAEAREYVAAQEEADMLLAGGLDL